MLLPLTFPSNSKMISAFTIYPELWVRLLPYTIWKLSGDIKHQFLPPSILNTVAAKNQVRIQMEIKPAFKNREISYLKNSAFSMVYPPLTPGVYVLVALFFPVGLRQQGEKSLFSFFFFFGKGTFYYILFYTKTPTAFLTKREHCPVYVCTTEVFTMQ